jgi:hypothetical protein
MLFVVSSYTVYGHPVTTTLVATLISRSAQILFIALIIFNWTYFPAPANFSVPTSSQPV